MNSQETHAIWEDVDCVSYPSSHLWGRRWPRLVSRTLVTRGTVGKGFLLPVEFCPGGAHEDRHKSRPLVLTYVRPGGPADR